MNKTHLFAASLFIAAVAFAKQGGTSILHLTVTVPFTGTGAGTVIADHKEQGHAEKESLNINATGLAANADYVLLASTTKNGNLTAAATLTTDSNGAINIRYGHPKGGSLPALLDPVSGLRTLEISVGGTQTVLTADMTAPSSIQYLVKDSLHNDGIESGAAGTLRVKSNGQQNQLRIRASGLTASSTYYLAFNGDIAKTLESDAKGGLSIASLPGGSPDILDITGIAILNGSSNSVLSATLP